MKFSKREDIEAPIDDVFAAVSDFDWFERVILRRGAEVSRIDSLTAPAPGMAWQSRFVFRGKPRVVAAELVRHEAPERLAMRTKGAGLDGLLSVDLVQLTPRRTRMSVQLEIRPETMTGRLLVQSLRLAKTNLTSRFKAGVGRFAGDIEARAGNQRIA